MQVCERFPSSQDKEIGQDSTAEGCYFMFLGWISSRKLGHQIEKKKKKNAETELTSGVLEKKSSNPKNVKKNDF